jgi:4-hydroxyphenylacetate 3-monooxygenase
MYAALNWGTEMYSELIDILRQLSGGGVFQMPASVSVMHDPALRLQFETYWQTPQLPALDRIKLFKLVWELVGSEFAGRHQQYEKFYAGASFIVRNHNFREAPWTSSTRSSTTSWRVMMYRLWGPTNSMWVVGECRC